MGKDQEVAKMDKEENIIITEKPTLRAPYMVCGISGWLDGGESATGSVQYLSEKLGARSFAEIPIEKFHVFHVSGQLSIRPHIKIEDGILMEHSFPQNQFFYWTNPHGDNDLILFLGAEPNLNWKGYARAILSIAKEFAVARIYLLGGLLDRTPHTREPNVSCLCSSPEIKEEMKEYGVQFTNYEGPGSFETTLLHFCQEERIQTVNFITRATYYPEFNIVIPRNPRSIRAMVRRLNSLLHLNLDTSDLDTQVKEAEAKLRSLASHDPKFRKYVEDLEKEYIEVEFEESLDISADEAIRIVEEMLRRTGEE
jgi:proteasome assembly chaperone (PAC2) family protein